MKQSALKLYLNLSLCDLKDARSGRACKYARKALDIDPKNVKALYRLARALHQLGEYEDAKRQIYKAHKLEPGNEEVMKELRALDNELKSLRKKDQALSKKMLNLSPQPKIVKKKTTTPAKPNAMLDLIIDRLKTFKEAEDLPEMPLPSTLTDDEISNIEDVAQGMGMTVKVVEQDNNKTISICKMLDQAPGR